MSAVVHGSPGAAVAAFQRSTISPLPFDDVLSGLRIAIEEAGLWVLHEIDPQTILQRAGYDIGPARQILFFHPDLMARLLRVDGTALLEAPLKIAVVKQPDGAVAMRWINPAQAFARYDNPALAALGEELALLCERIVQSCDGANPAAYEPVDIPNPRTAPTLEGVSQCHSHAST